MGVNENVSNLVNLFSTILPAPEPEPSTTFDNIPNLFTNQEFDPFNPCPRKLWELVVGLVFSIGIILSNLLCIRLKLGQSPRHHPQNKLFVINLAVSNLLCGFAIVVMNTLDIILFYNRDHMTAQVCLLICRYWAPVFIFCVMLPYVTLASLGIDIAYYCHQSFDYHRKMSKPRLWLTLVLGWVYTAAVVSLTVVIVPHVLCDKTHWELNIHIIIFPIMLMCLPAIFVVLIFAHILRSYWKSSQRLARRISMSSTIAFNCDTKSRLVKKFIKKFLHVIIFSILCGLVFTFLTVTEVIIEQRHQRICMLYKLDRMAVSLNALLAPWFYCLGTKQYRKNIYRRYMAWRNSSSLTSRVKFGCHSKLRHISSNKNLPLGDAHTQKKI